MSYRKSQARRHFEVESERYIAALRLVDRLGIDPNLRQYVIASAVFLGHASFENYVRDLFSGLARGLTLSGALTNTIPVELRMFLLHKSGNWSSHFANYSANRDEPRLLQNLAQFFSGPRKDLAVDGLRMPAFSGVELLDQKSYPSEENLHSIFQRVGIPNFFDRMNANLRADSRLILRGLADKRTALAHNAAVPGVSTGDMIVELARFGGFVAAMDRVTHAHARDRLGRGVWGFLVMTP